jgi:signal transduction histidine kinase
VDSERSPLSETANSPHGTLRQKLAWFFAPLARHSLSRRVLILTLVFAALTGIVIYVPTLTQIHDHWFDTRLTAGKIAVLALKTRGSEAVEANIEAALLSQADILTLAVIRDDARYLILSVSNPPSPARFYDRRNLGSGRSVLHTLRTLLGGRSQMARAIAELGEADELVEIVVDLDPLYEHLIHQSFRFLYFFAVVFLLAIAVLYASLHLLLVKPIRRITNSIAQFHRAPERPESIISASPRSDEIGIAERELAAMQSDVHAALRQRGRLAALGSAVARINHDLRNVLATGQLVAERLKENDDPKIRSAAGRLLGIFARSISLCANTLKFSRQESNAPRKVFIPLARMVDEVSEDLPLAGPPAVEFVNKIDRSLYIEADREYLMRILFNLMLNAVQAMQQTDAGGALEIEAAVTGDGEKRRCTIRIDDHGPGLPARVRENLFEPFTGFGRAQGSGLGLAIAQELARAHGGEITLDYSGVGGSSFLVTLPCSLVKAGEQFAKRLSQAGA